MPDLLNRSLQEVLLALDDAQHLAVEVAKPMITKVFIVNKTPLATSVLITPAVAFAREVDPLWVSELVAHEVKITSVDGCSRHQAYHLVQGDAAFSNSVDVLLCKVPIHIGINEAEDDGLVAHKCLVVTFAIRDCLLVWTAVLYLPEDAAWLPVLVCLLLNGLYPIVGNVHRHAVVEAETAIFELGSESWHSAHFFGNGYCLRVNLVYKAVGKRQIAYRIVVLMSVEVVAIVGECLTKSVTVIEH